MVGSAPRGLAPGVDDRLGRAIARRYKLGPVLYVFAFAFVFVNAGLGFCLYLLLVSSTSCPVTAISPLPRAPVPTGELNPVSPEGFLRELSRRALPSLRAPA